jgi:hypothetical protein
MAFTKDELVTTDIPPSLAWEDVGGPPIIMPFNIQIQDIC